MQYENHNKNGSKPQLQHLFPEIVKLREAGLNPNQIAIKLGVKPNYIYNYIRRYSTDDSQTFNVHQYDNWVI